MNIYFKTSTKRKNMCVSAIRSVCMQCWRKKLLEKGHLATGPGLSRGQGTPGPAEVWTAESVARGSGTTYHSPVAPSAHRKPLCLPAENMMLQDNRISCALQGTLFAFGIQIKPKRSSTGTRLNCENANFTVNPSLCQLLVFSERMSSSPYAASCSGWDALWGHLLFHWKVSEMLRSSDLFLFDWLFVCHKHIQLILIRPQRLWGSIWNWQH